MLNVVEPILPFPLCKYICLSTIFYVLSPLSQLLELLKTKRLWKCGAVVCLEFDDKCKVFMKARYVFNQGGTRQRARRRSSTVHNVVIFMQNRQQQQQQRRDGLFYTCD